MTGRPLALDDAGGHSTPGAEVESAPAGVAPGPGVALTGSDVADPSSAAGGAGLDALGVLGELGEIAAGLGADDIARDAAALAERLSERRFYVACVGQFKRGKSSLVNALVGRAILPTGILPITTVPTVLRHGPALRSRVRVRGAWREIAPDALEDYVSEERNPENALGVEAVEVWVPSPVLAGGLCLVDTPGLGSVFRGDSAATREFLPHVDAALVVIGVDPPLTAEELDLVEVVARQAPSLLVVLNKADRFGDEERSQAVAFAERMLAGRLGRAATPVLQVSATERLAASQRSVPERDWGALVSTLGALARGSGAALVAAAGERGVARLAARCLAEIGAQRDALSRPLAESEARLRGLEQAIGDAAHRALQLGHLFNAEQQRLGRIFAERRSAFLKPALPAATAELDAAIDAVPTRYGPALRSQALAAARATGRRHVEPWLAGEQRAAEAAYREVADRFVTLANEFLSQVHRSGGEYVERLPAALDSDAGLRVPSRYYFREVLPLVYGSPLRAMLDVLRPAGAERAAVRRDARKYLGDLLSMNTTLVQNDLDQRVADSRLRLEGRIQDLLRSVYVTVERALQRARSAHAAGAQAVEAALARLDQLGDRVAAHASGNAAR